MRIHIVILIDTELYATTVTVLNLNSVSFAIIKQSERKRNKCYATPTCPACVLSQRRHVYRRPHKHRPQSERTCEQF